ncbi:MAG: ATP-grasp domain-containing protein [Anaerolineales bacterium]
MQAYDLCFSWYWLYDQDFVRYIEECCASHGLTLWEITPANLLEAVDELYTGRATFGSFLDRAADDLRFEPIRRFALEHAVHRLNPAELSHWSEDKATMHLELIEAGLQTPYTIILAPFVTQPVLPAMDLSPLGTRFVLKPAVGGGGEGVKMNASSLQDVQCARLEYPDQKYLVQEQVEPRLISGREAWFRIFYVGGCCIPCWWHPVTHEYGTVTSEQETRFELQPLRRITERIACVCRLDWFSTEIVLTRGGRYVVVDYVNDGIDTRIQSQAADGVPDEVMMQIADGLISLVLSKARA